MKSYEGAWNIGLLSIHTLLIERPFSMMGQEFETRHFYESKYG